MLTPPKLPRIQVLLDCSVQDLEGVFDLVARQVAGRQPVVAERIRTRLRRCNERCPADLGHGIALPHAMVPGLGQSCLVYLRSRTPIRTGFARSRLSDALTLLVPNPALSEDHQLLAELSARLCDRSVARALRTARSAEEIERLLVEPEPQRAAA